MTPPRARRADLLWAAALLLLIVGHFWFPNFGAGHGRDSYSSAAEGKLAFFLTERDLHPERRSVRRNTEPLVKLMPPENEFETIRWRDDRRVKRTICLLGPARYPNLAEWDMLLKWVENGGQLLIAARDDKPDFEIEKLNIKVRKIPGTIDADSDQIDTSLMDEGQLVWQSKAQIIASSRARQLVSAARATQAVVQNHGKGRVVVVASEFIFTNESMLLADQSNAEWAHRLLEAAGESEEIVFDESLNISGTPKAVGLLLNPVFRPLAVQLLIGLVLFGWWRSRRFGPMLPARTTGRQNVVDHTDAVGVLLFRTGDGTGALRAYLRQLFTELKMKTHRGREDRVIDPIAHRLGKSTESVKRLLQRCVKATKGERLDRREAAHLLRQLAVIRRAALMKNQKPSPQTESATV